MKDEFIASRLKYNKTEQTCSTSNRYEYLLAADRVARWLQTRYIPFLYSWCCCWCWEHSKWVKSKTTRPLNTWYADCLSHRLIIPQRIAAALLGRRSSSIKVLMNVLLYLLFERIALYLEDVEESRVLSPSVCYYSF